MQLRIKMLAIWNLLSLMLELQWSQTLTWSLPSLNKVHGLRVQGRQLGFHFLKGAPSPKKKDKHRFSWKPPNRKGEIKVSTEWIATQTISVTNLCGGFNAFTHKYQVKGNQRNWQKENFTPFQHNAETISNDVETMSPLPHQSGKSAEDNDDLGTFWR